VEVSARRSAALPCRPVCADCSYNRSSSVKFCGVWGSRGTLDQDIDRPTQLRCLWPQNMEPTILPALRRPELSLSSFKRQLKTHLFQHLLVIAVQSREWVDGSNGSRKSNGSHGSWVTRCARSLRKAFCLSLL